MRLLTFFFITALIQATQAQSYKTDSVISMLVNDIEREQIKTKDVFFPGMFYSFRGASSFPHNYKPDNNIFFTAIGSFTLKNIKQHLKDEEKIIIDSILNRSSRSYDYFQHKNELPLYNFWPPGGKIMPHSLIVQHMSKQFSISEDADDTVMILMGLPNNDDSNAFVKRRLLEVSNQGSAGKKIKSTFKKYRNFKAYTTYLGYKMQTDFDFAVQCNILYFNFEKSLPLTIQDTATIQLLSKMIKDRLHVKNPKFIAPYYGKSSLILYHLTRLMARFRIPELEAQKPIIINDLKILLQKSKQTLEKIILQTSLLRMGEQVDLPDEKEIYTIRNTYQHRFSFFQARPAYWCRPFLKNILLHLEFVNYHFFSPTHDKILLLENLALRKS